MRAPEIWICPQAHRMVKSVSANKILNPWAHQLQIHASDHRILCLRTRISTSVGAHADFRFHAFSCLPCLIGRILSTRVRFLVHADVFVRESSWTTPISNSRWQPSTTHFHDYLSFLIDESNRPSSSAVLCCRHCLFRGTNSSHLLPDLSNSLNRK